MPETVTLTLPDSVLRPLERSAQAIQQPIEELLVTVLESSLPSLQGLPDQVISNLTALESVDNDALCRVMREKVPEETRAGITELRERQQYASLTPAQEDRLALLQDEADLVMLRKARAAVLLRFRGKRLPTLAELDQLAESSDEMRVSAPCGETEQQVSEDGTPRRGTKRAAEDKGKNQKASAAKVGTEDGSRGAVSTAKAKNRTKKKSRTR